MIDEQSLPDGSARDLGVSALIVGFFASAWFSWGGGDAPSGWAAVMTAGSILSLVVAVIGAVFAFHARRSASVMREGDTGRRYGIIVGIEFAAAGIGAGVLGATGHEEYIAPWVAAVVGLHFFPLAPVLRAPGLKPLGALVVAVAVAATVVGLTTSVKADFVAGLGAGVLLLGSAGVSLVQVGLRRRAPTAGG